MAFFFVTLKSSIRRDTRPVTHSEQSISEIMGFSKIRFPIQMQFSFFNLKNPSLRNPPLEIQLPILARWSTLTNC